MLHTADMDPNLLGAVDDSIDPNIFNFIDVANSAVSPNLEDGVGFTWADDLISSAELDPSNSDSPTVSQGGMQHVVAATRQQMLAGGVVQHHMGGVQVMMGVQQQQQQGMVAVSSAGGVNAQQLMQNQTIIQGSMSSPYIIKASPVMPAATPSSIQASQSTNTMINASPHQYLPSSVTLVSRANTPSQSPSPHLSRSLTPSQTLSSSMGRPPSQPQHMAVSGASSQNINLLQLNQQQISQQVPLQNFVTNQTPQQGNLLQGHTVLASHGSNIVHTQNALIQNPNVVNVNVAHVLPNQLNLQGTLIQTPQGKFLIQSPAGGQQLQGQLNLGALSNLGQVQVAGGLQQTVMAQPTGSVALGNSPHQQQPNFSLVNLGGPQGQQILIQRSPATHGVQAAQGGQVGQTNLILRTVAPNQQILQQQRINATASSGQTVNMASAQVTQQLVTQTGASQNLQLQQLIGGGGQQLRLVQPTGTPQSQGQATLGGNVLLQSVVGGNQQVRLVGQQHQAQVSMAGNKPGTVTLNLAGQNLNLQQLQQLGGLGGMQGIQLSTQQHPQFVIQQQPQIQVAGSNASVMAASIQQNSMQTVSQLQNSLQTLTQQTVTQQVVNTGSGVNIGSKPVIGKSIANSANMFSDNILSQALTASGIEPEDVMDLFNGSEVSQDSMTMGQPEQQPTPPPPPKKKKKKKKDLETVQPVVLSSMKDLKSGLSTASPTAVTTTISQASVALPGQASHAVGLGGMHLTISGQNIITSVTTASIQPTIGMPAVAMPGSFTGTAVSAGMQVQSTPMRGKYAPPNVSVKPTMPNLQLSLAEKQQLKNIQNELQRLQLKATLSEADRALAQNLEMQRKKLLAQAQNQVLMAMNQQKQQQQVTVTSNMVGQPLVAQPQVLSQQQSPSQLKLEVKPMNSASANNVLQIQAKPSNLPAKLKLVSPKLEPGMSGAQSDSTDLKPVLGMPVGQVTVANTQASLQTGTGNVVMAMSSPQDVGQVAGKSMILQGQQNVVRLQFAQKSQSVAMTPSTPQQVIISSPQKDTVMSNGSGATVVTGCSAVQHVPVTNLAPSQARPVQIKIANQILMLQLTPAQQEKLELHLSRMTLDQQHVFFRTQQHVLAKLQLRTDPNMVNQQQNQVAGGSQTGACVGGGSTAVVMAPTVVAAVSAGGDAPSQKSAALGTAPITVTTVTQPQQLPVTVQQALESTSIKTETCSSVSVHSPIIKRVHVPEIPKASMIHQQLSKDQANAVAPDTRNAFKDYREACRRLLRYHTFQSHGPSQDTFDEADCDFDSMSEDLVEQKDAMFTKYRYLLYEESMRGYPTAEMVFILRMMNQDMHNTLREDKMIAEKDPDSFIPMPAEYLEKKIPPDEDSDEEKQFYDDDDDEEEDEYEEEVEAVSDKEENGDEKDIKSAENKENEEGEFKDRERSGDDGENNESSLYDSMVSPSSAKIDDGGESRNDDIEDREAGESVSGSLNDQSESANTSYENASFDISFQTSTPAKGHRNVSKSDSLAPSSPSPVVLTPSPEKPPSRSIFRLVIRNDGKGFTSRLASERRKSMSKAKHKNSRHHSGGDNSDDDSHQRTSGDEESEGSENDSAEIEYIDVDKYSRNVSVTLERLSDSMSQVYGVSAKSPSASTACVNTKSPASSTSSSRKKRKAERDDESVRHKKDRHSDNRGEKEKSSAGRDVEKQRTKDSEKQRTKDLERQRASHSESPCGSSPGSTCDLKEGQSSSKTKHSESKKHSSVSFYRDGESTKHSSSSSHHDGVVKKHSSSSSHKGSSSKKHKDGSSRSGGNTPTPQGSSSCSSVSRNGLDEDSLGEDKDSSSAETRQDDNVEIDTSCAEKGKDRVNPLIHATAGTVYSTSGSMHKGVKTETEMQFAVDSIMDLHDEQFHRQQDRGSHSDDLNEIVPESPEHSDQSANPPAFAEHIPPNLMQTDKMFNISSSDNEMETLYEPQMQNAIDSILNGSGGSNGNGESADKAYHLSELSPGQKDDEDCDNVSGEESAAEHTGGDEGEGDSALITTDSQEMVVDDDLDAAVQSILM